MGHRETLRRKRQKGRQKLFRKGEIKMGRYPGKISYKQARRKILSVLNDDLFGSSFRFREYN